MSVSRGGFLILDVFYSDKTYKMVSTTYSAYPIIEHSLVTTLPGTSCMKSVTDIIILWVIFIGKNHAKYYVKS